MDVDFAGNWDLKEAEDPYTAISRHEYVVMYSGFPLIQKPQLQIGCALSSTESDCTGLSYTLQNYIPTISLLKEVKEKGSPIKTGTTEVH